MLSYGGTFQARNPFLSRDNFNKTDRGVGLSSEVTFSSTNCTWGSLFRPSFFFYKSVLFRPLLGSQNGCCWPPIWVGCGIFSWWTRHAQNLFSVVRAHLTLQCVIFHPQRVCIPENHITHRTNAGITFFEMPTLNYFFQYDTGWVLQILKKLTKKFEQVFTRARCLYSIKPPAMNFTRFGPAHGPLHQ